MTTPLSSFCLAVLVLAAAGTSLPTREPVRNSIDSIVSMAQTTLVHIKKLTTRLPVPPQIKVSSPSITGLDTISLELGLLADGLQDPSLDLLSQIHADVSSLGGRVRSLAGAMGCSAQATPRAETNNSHFPDSHFYLSLTKVQLYLERLLLNTDKLKIC